MADRLRASKGQRAVALARAALFWERAAPVWAPPALALLAVVTAAALGLLQPLPIPLHAGLVAAVLGAGAFAAWPGLRRFQLPTLDEGRRRAERDAGLDHAPLTAVEDRAETGDAELWAAHLRRAEADAERARGRRPRAGLAAADPFALRFALPLLLAFGVWAEPEGLGRRLETAIRPDLKADALPLRLEAWAAPPAYTGRPPQPLPPGGGTVSLPKGSILTLTVRGAAGPPVLEHQGGSRFEPQAERVHMAKLSVDRSGALVIRRGGALGRWALNATPDKPPSIAFAAPPARGERDALALLYRARDDYGVSSVRLRLSSGLRTLERPVEVPASPEEPQATALDLTDTPFAGKTVSAVLIATDAAGQEARSRGARIKLPVRTWRDPAARELAQAADALRREWRPYAVLRRPAPEPENVPDARLQMTLGPYYALHDAPPAVRGAAATAQELLVGAGPALRDPLAAAALTWALRRLAGAQTLRAAKALAPDLLAVADRLERGPASSAEEGLRAAQQRLREAIARGAPPEDIARLLDEVRQAMAAYLAALQRAPAPSGEQPQGGTITAADLDALWRAVEEAAARGDAEHAMALMDAIARLLASIQPGQGQGGEGQGAGGRAFAQLQDQQRALGDETFGLGQGEGGRDPDALAAAQSALAKQTRRSARGAAAQPLNAAAAAMDEAAAALRFYDVTGAARAQRRAQAALTEAAQAADPNRNARSLMDRALGEADPLGRRASGGDVVQGDGSAQADAPAQTAREALDAIRARAADRSRPEEELRYLERLLERF